MQTRNKAGTMKPLAEKYRPNRLEQVVGQDRAVAVVSRLLARSQGGRAYWITGKSGTGKTTIARIIAQEQADSLYIREVVARQLTLKELQAAVDSWRYSPMATKPGHALIVNESHGLSRPLIETFLGVIEDLQDNVVVIFTTTRDGNDLFEEKLDSAPFGSRCISLNLAARNICQPFAVRAREIAEAEDLNGKPIEAYISLMRSCRNNLRAALNQIECGAML